MYAIIRAGGKQSKVQSGDVLDIERVKGDETELTFEPLLVVDDEGNAVSDLKELAKASVQAKILGESHGPKIDIFKYKNKTGYSRRQGHRQKYTRIEITEIKLPGAKKAAPAKKAGSDDKPAATKASAAKKPAASKASTAKKPAATKASTAKKPAASKAATSKASSTKKASTAKKAEPASSEEE
jgi:large subunit ribosomal protein L21